VEHFQPGWVGAGIVFFLGAIAARPLIKLNLWVYDKLGFHGFARFWERQLGWWVPTVRVLCVAGLVVVILLG